MKTQRELNLHYWGAIHEIVEDYNKEHGCDVKPWECVKQVDRTYFKDAPRFEGTPEKYQFAVAILYDEQKGVHKPVFQGDTVYAQNGCKVIVGDYFDLMGSSWHKPQPKRTFIVGKHYLTNRGDVVTLNTHIEVDGMYNRFDYVFYDVSQLLTDANGITGYGEKIDREVTESDIERLRLKLKRPFEINGFQLTEKEFDWLIYLLKDQPRGTDMATTILRKLDEK